MVIFGKDDKVALIAELENAGEAVVDVVANLSLDGVQVQGALVSAMRLLPGETRDITLTWRIPANAELRDYDLRVVASVADVPDAVATSGAATVTVRGPYTDAELLSVVGNAIPGLCW